MNSELILDIRDLTIEAVHMLDATGQPTPAGFNLEASDAIFQALRVNLPAGAVAVRVAYRTGPATAVQWMLSEQTAGIQPFLFTQSQVILART